MLSVDDVKKLSEFLRRLGARCTEVANMLDDGKTVEDIAALLAVPAGILDATLTSIVNPKEGKTP